MKLNRTNLRDLPKDVLTPSYDPADVTPGVLHLGMGNFHRAHEGVYLDRVASNGDLTWGTVGVGFRTPDKSLNRAAADQDGLYTLETVENGVEMFACSLRAKVEQGIGHVRGCERQIGS